MDDTNITQEASEETTIQTEEEKQSTKQWTQSEVDKHTAALLNREKEKYKGYEEQQKQLEQLLKEKKEKEEAGKSEIEKAISQIEELTKRNQELEEYSVKYEQERVRSLVLGDPKYASLPTVYKNSISGSSNEDEVRQSAEKALEEYKKDFGSRASETFGVPSKKIGEKVIEKVTVTDPTSLQNLLRSRISGLVNK